MEAVSGGNTIFFEVSAFAVSTFFVPAHPNTNSDNSNKIAIVLERHENRLDESERTDTLILKMMEEMKDQEEKNHRILHERIDRIQKKVDANQKFVVGAGAVLATLVAVLQVVPPILKVLTPQVSSVSITPVEINRSV